MPKERFNLFLSGTTTASATITYTFAYDLKKLIPLNLRKKKFMLYSSFDSTGNWGTNTLAGVQVYTNITSPRYNKSYTYNTTTTQLTPITNYQLIGVAMPYVNNSTTNFSYSYKHNGCIPSVFEYPDSPLSIIEVNIQLVMATAPAANYTWTICFTFEAIDEPKKLKK